jgi:hypothetical protein
MAKGLEFENQWRQDFSPLHIIQTGSGACPASYPLGTWGSFPTGKSGWGVKLTTNLHPVRKSRICGSTCSPYFYLWTVTQLVKTFLVFYGTWCFITMYTTANHYTILYASWISTIYFHPFLYDSFLRYSSYAFQAVSSLPKILYAFLTLPLCPTHLIWSNYTLEFHWTTT